MKNKQFLLEIENLVVKSQDAKQKNKEITIINDLNLTIEEGLVHAIMGPNGSGKSTLSKVLAGHPSYFVRNGKIKFKGQNFVSKNLLNNHIQESPTLPRSSYTENGVFR